VKNLFSEMVQLNALLHVTQSKFNHVNKRLRRHKTVRQAAPAAICSWLSLTG